MLWQTGIAFLIRVYLENKKELSISLFPEMDENMVHRRKTYPLVIFDPIGIFIFAR